MRTLLIVATLALASCTAAQQEKFQQDMAKLQDGFQEKMADLDEKLNNPIVTSLVPFLPPPLDVIAIAVGGAVGLMAGGKKIAAKVKEKQA